ncbi:MAG: aminopeptidase P family protein [Desulfobacula sp.]|jgi:Xaa-Pro dipeptidase|uniref:M24 family metallopeptidase n=1 Tax=Desulfobacula sp. TaxID=2593537 RepID=UPI001D5B01D5|nr:aminopeptidase P family protein [Desulfobacula sp.]MBT3485599.1 aminopeptidase P family protein [Desulfobacula sp.]MBT4027459.1 aminopeptidase P family protein [Desulfobacula sp.]MBT4197821.1 aminopeptidase P family protein [Desulfobacula sp.]MBT4508300.1 aminopeptidase P family protein [Desulfobacula sp.]
MSLLKRGFEVSEFEMRTLKAQKMMTEHKLDAIFLTTEPNVRYFSGFFTQFWESPTRPWFLIVPLTGKPIAVIPEIGASGMAATWIDDIHTWASPNPADDGISLVADILNNIPCRYGRIGATLGMESYLRMPFNDFMDLSSRLKDTAFVDIATQIHRLRSIKSKAEIEKIRKACEIAHIGFANIPDHARIGQTERDICKQMRIDMLHAGADIIKYLISGSGPDGYDSIIMGPTDRQLNMGDVLIIDVGAVYDGYFSDFDRNFAFGRPSDATLKAYTAVYEATDAGFKAARPGATTSDVYTAMWSVMEQAGALGNDVGRLGHGLGIQLTEWPSNTASDNTLLEPGMVITLEPGMMYAPGKSMVHEENIVITKNGAEYLSVRCPPELTIIE